MGHLAALGRFIAWFTNMLLPFFTNLCGVQKFGWTVDCNSVFDAIKHCLIEPPILNSLEKEEELYMYLVISNYVAHQVTTLTNQPPRITLHKLDLSRQMMKWAIKLNRASGARVGLVLLSLTREPIEQCIHLDFFASNNEAEYKAIIIGLELALGTCSIKSRNTK
ncbi:hypothetical protein CK203_043602 [Vitis vinifera]|uniref:Reverse transcriptase/retrotransposon-derived protein RNase H-like domain-containing protein n=1 Tax=Vitis vinifera TaxID=29760 RepID=A0A438HYJ1_VITVI|nr:hypothetical protein CK203_043602 [Vitis vinifera]